jgi:hypothetical protein
LGEKIADVLEKPVLKGGYSFEMNLALKQLGAYFCKMVFNTRIVVAVKRLIIFK